MSRIKTGRIYGSYITMILGLFGTIIGFSVNDLVLKVGGLILLIGSPALIVFYFWLARNPESVEKSENQLRIEKYENNYFDKITSERKSAI